MTMIIPRTANRSRKFDTMTIEIEDVIFLMKKLKKESDHRKTAQVKNNLLKNEVDELKVSLKNETIYLEQEKKKSEDAKNKRLILAFQIQASRGTAAELQNKIDNLKESEARVLKEKEEAKNEESAARKELASCRKKIETYKEHLATAEAKIVGLESLNTELQKEKAKQLTELRKEMKGTEQKKNFFEKKLKQGNDNLKKMEADKSKQLTFVLNEKEELRKKMKGIEQKKNELEKSVTLLKQDMVELEEKSKQYNDNLNYMQQILFSEQSNKKKVTKELNDVKQELQEVKLKMEESQALFDKALFDRRTQINGLEQQLRHAKQEALNARKSLNSFCMKYNNIKLNAQAFIEAVQQNESDGLETLLPTETAAAADDELKCDLSNYACIKVREGAKVGHDVTCPCSRYYSEDSKYCPAASWNEHEVNKKRKREEMKINNAVQHSTVPQVKPTRRSTTDSTRHIPRIKIKLPTQTNK